MDMHHHNNKLPLTSGPEGVHSAHKSELLPSDIFKLAMGATFHCLIGCGIGEVTGMIISTAMGLNNLYSILLSILLGFIAGMALGILPLRKFGFSLRNALKTVIIGEGLSIGVMEAFDVLTELAIPGVMSAQLTDFIFWIGMVAALVVGFIAAFPINYIFIKRGIRHQH